VPFGVQKLEQQLPFEVHVSPSAWQPPGEGSAVHVPVVPPSAMVHLPLQHWVFELQVLPVCAQTKMQLPEVLQEPLQQS
jgi:hypothetical protein